MAFNVRLAAYRGMAQVQNLNSKQYTGDTVFLLDEPPIWVQTVVVDAAAVTSLVPDADNDKVRILHVEVPDDQAVRYRIVPENYTVVAANTDCLSVSGKQNFVFSKGWRISMIDAAGLP